MSHQGLVANVDPVTFFGRGGIKPEEVLQDAKDIYAKVPHPKGLGVHVLTGPIYIEGASPATRSKCACSISNCACLTASTIPARAPACCATSCRRRRRASSGPPARKVALSRPASRCRCRRSSASWRWRRRPISSWSVRARPPNGPATSISKSSRSARRSPPVFNTGALFFTGDPHGVQGDGEVDGGALEQSLTATLQFILHKGEARPCVAARRGRRELLHHGHRPRSQRRR